MNTYNQSRQARTRYKLIGVLMRGPLGYAELKRRTKVGNKTLDNFVRSSSVSKTEDGKYRLTESAKVDYQNLSKDIPRYRHGGGSVKETIEVYGSGDHTTLELAGLKRPIPESVQATIVEKIRENREKETQWVFQQVQDYLGSGTLELSSLTSGARSKRKLESQGY